MTSEFVARTCERHPDRPGAAACMSCRAIVCHECTTTWEGIHYCPACLAARARAGTRRSHAASWVAAILASLLLMLVAVEAAVTTGTLFFAG